jgi:hypothetical protein
MAFGPSVSPLGFNIAMTLCGVLNTIESAKVSQCFFNSGGHANMSKLQEVSYPPHPPNQIDVCYWHKADFKDVPNDVCVQGRSGHVAMSALPLNVLQNSPASR